jgi:hypothetical protein
MAGFYSAPEGTAPAVLWPGLSPPFTPRIGHSQILRFGDTGFKKHGFPDKMLDTSVGIILASKETRSSKNEIVQGE